MHTSLLQDRQTGETINISAPICIFTDMLVLICDKERSSINNGVMFRVKLGLRLRRYSLQRKRLADTAFLLSTLAFSGSNGYFNRANISAGSSDTPFLVCTNV